MANIVYLVKSIRYRLYNIFIIYCLSFMQVEQSSNVVVKQNVNNNNQIFVCTTKIYSSTAIKKRTKMNHFQIFSRWAFETSVNNDMHTKFLMITFSIKTTQSLKEFHETLIVVNLPSNVFFYCGEHSNTWLFETMKILKWNKNFKWPFELCKNKKTWTLRLQVR